VIVVIIVIVAIVAIVNIVVIVAAVAGDVLAPHCETDSIISVVFLICTESPLTDPKQWACPEGGRDTSTMIILVIFADALRAVELLILLVSSFKFVDSYGRVRR